MIRRFFALALLAPLAACASAQSAYPSLAIRPAERVTGTLQPAPVPTPAPPVTPQSTLDRLAQLTADGAAAHKSFQDQLASARPIVSAARGSAVGDDAWARAEAALADVRAARSKTMVPLADLDRLFVDAATHAQPTDRIAAARERVSSLVVSEDAALGALTAGLP